METETVVMPKGMFAAVCNVLRTVPAEAYGRAPQGAVTDLINAMERCKVEATARPITEREKEIAKKKEGSNAI